MSTDAKHEAAAEEVRKHFVAKPMKYSGIAGVFICPHCNRELRHYEGLRVCYCKFCGGKISRQ